MDGLQGYNYGNATHGSSIGAGAGGGHTPLHFTPGGPHEARQGYEPASYSMARPVAGARARVDAAYTRRSPRARRAQLLPPWVAA